MKNKFINISIGIILLISGFTYGVFVGKNKNFPYTELQSIWRSIKNNYIVIKYDDIVVEDSVIAILGNPISLNKASYNQVSKQDYSFIIGKENKKLLQYKYFPSIEAEKKYFIKELMAKRERLNKESIIIDKSLILKSLHDKWKVKNEDRLTNLQKKMEKTIHSGVLKEFEGSTEEGILVQFILGVPTKWNGKIIIAMHGCGGSPDAVFGQTSDTYLNEFGLKAMKRGFMVYAPYVLSRCDWFSDFDDIANSVGESALSYEIKKINALSNYVINEHKNSSVNIWGISLGGQIATFCSLFHNFEYSVISGGMVFDYQDQHLDYFQNRGLKGNYWPLSGSMKLDMIIKRSNVILSNLPRKYILSFGSENLERSTLETVREMKLYADLNYPNQEVLQIVFFKGYHETAPESILNILQ